MAIFWEMYQQSQIHDAKSEAASAKSKTLSLKEELGRIEDRIDSLALTCQAMWELIRERTTLTDNDIESRMQEIDLRDGKADGRMQMPAMKCTDCSRVISRRHARCLYCGAEFKKPHIFE